MLMKEKCSEEKIEAVLVSLEAKKAFDLVNYKYFEENHRKYGYSPILINCFKTLYNEITTRIMVNGYQSEMI